MNPYSYGANRPLAHPDPYGRFIPPCVPECFILGAGLLAGEGAAQLGDYSPSDSPYERSYKDSLTGDNVPPPASDTEEGDAESSPDEGDQAEPSDAGSGDFGGGGSDDGGSVTGDDSGYDDYGEGDDSGGGSADGDSGDSGDSSGDGTDSSNGTDSGPISMDDAVEQGSDYVGGEGEMQTTPGGNYQFNNESYDDYGNRINDIARFDVNPDSSDYQRWWLNVE